MPDLYIKYTEPRLSPLQSSILLLVTIEPGPVSAELLLEKIHVDYWKDTTMEQLQTALEQLERRGLVELINR